jgi:hypothetical protein
VQQRHDFLETAAVAACSEAVLWFQHSTSALWEMCQVVVEVNPRELNA